MVGVKLKSELMREAKPQWKAVLRRTGSPVAIAFLGVLMASAPLFGARGETLAEAMAMAYRNNQNIEAQRAFLLATDEGAAQRSEEVSVGNECGSKCRVRWSPYH